jgi:inner membrane protein
MEPVTHLLTGACLARSGCNRKAAYATLTMVIAAELPDIDTLWSLRGPVEGFAHHRGITHSFVGLPFEAALLVGAVYGLHRWRLWRRKMQVSPLRSEPSGKERSLLGPVKPLTKVPVRWGVLYGFALLALLSHLLLDFTNNYGLRPFFPFNDRWYAASLVFIFDPLIFGLLLAALVLPALFGLISSEVGVKRQTFRGRGLAIAALLAIMAIWTFRAVEHNKAVELAMGQTYAYAPKLSISTSEAADIEQSDVSPDVVPIYLQPQRVLASPDPLNPFHWSVAMDFGPLYQLAEVNLRNGAVTPQQATFAKPDRSVAVLRAQASPLGRAYMDWSPMPIVTVDQPFEGPSADSVEAPVPASSTTVTFRDPRFLGGIDWLHLGGGTPLTARVTLDARGRVLRQSLDGRTER